MAMLKPKWRRQNIMRWFWGRVEEGKREVGERETLLAKIFGEELKWKYGEQVSNSNINFSSNWCDNTLSMGPIKSLYLPSCHWTLDLNFWKLLISVFSFHHMNSNFWVLSDVMETSLKKQAKQLVFCETHEFWTMSYENWVISLSFVPIQTASIKDVYYFKGAMALLVL